MASVQFSVVDEGAYAEKPATAEEGTCTPGLHIARCVRAARVEQRRPATLSQ